MSDLIEKTVSNHMANKKSQGNENETKLPTDTMSIARRADDRLDSFKNDLYTLKARLGGEKSLLEEVKKAIKTTIDNI